MHTIDEKYVFSGRLDIDSLDKLYGNDLKKAVEVFKSSLQDIQEELELSEIHFKNNDVEGLLTSCISIRSSASNVGLTRFAEYVQTFEDVCKHAKNTDEIKETFFQLNMLITEAVYVIRQELIRMRMFLNVRA